MQQYTQIDDVVGFSISSSSSSITIFAQHHIVDFVQVSVHRDPSRPASTRRVAVAMHIKAMV
jgi:hypothetical protein